MEGKFSLFDGCDGGVLSLFFNRFLGVCVDICGRLGGLGGGVAFVCWCVV